MAGRTIFITGASRGIGKSIALKAAKDGANIVIAAKTAQQHPKLPGTIYTAASESNYRLLILQQIRISGINLILQQHLDKVLPKYFYVEKHYF